MPYYICKYHIHKNTYTYIYIYTFIYASYFNLEQVFFMHFLVRDFTQRKVLLSGIKKVQLQHFLA